MGVKKQTNKHSLNIKYTVHIKITADPETAQY